MVFSRSEPEKRFSQSREGGGGGGGGRNGVGRSDAENKRFALPPCAASGSWTQRRGGGVTVGGRGWGGAAARGQKGNGCNV